MDSDAELEEARAREEMLDPRDVGEIVLDAVRADEPYVITHPSWKARIEERCRALLAAFDRAAARGSAGGVHPGPR